MKRWRLKLLNLAAAGCALLLILVALLHARGGFPTPPAATHLAGDWSYLLSGDNAPEGALTMQLIVYRSSPAPTMVPFSSAMFNFYLVHQTTRWHWHSFGLEHGPNITNTSSQPSRFMVDGTRTLLIAPYWAIEIALLILSAIAWLPQWRPRRVVEAGQAPCPNCGYDLRATPQRCPECGTRPAAVNAGGNI